MIDAVNAGHLTMDQEKGTREESRLGVGIPCDNSLFVEDVERAA